MDLDETPLLPPEINSAERPVVFVHGRSSWISQLLFLWLTPFINLGSQRPLTFDDLGGVPPEFEAKTVSDLFQDEWKRPQPAGGWKLVENQHFWTSFLRVHKQKLLISGALFFFGHMLSFVGPLGLSELVRFVARQQEADGGEPDSENDSILPWSERSWFGFLVVGVMTVSSLAQTTFVVSHTQIVIEIGMNVRTALTNAIFLKSMRLSNTARANTDTGAIVNLITNDNEKVKDFFNYIHYCWVYPITLILSFLFMGLYLGLSALATLAALFVLLPILVFTLRQITLKRKQSLKLTDVRAKTVTETIQGIRTVKLNAWERFLTARIGRSRMLELNSLKNLAVWRAINASLVSSVPLLLALATFSTYSLFSGKELTADSAFTVLALINNMKNSLNNLPTVINVWIDAQTSASRMLLLLSGTEVEKPSSEDRYSSHGPTKTPTILSATLDFDLDAPIEQPPSSNSTAAVPAQESRFSAARSRKSPGLVSTTANLSVNDGSPYLSLYPVEIRGASFSWTGSRSALTLKSIDLTVETGELVMIVGSVGSGKSSFLSAVLGEIDRVEGYLARRGSIAYVPQTAWILNSTVKDNIIFGNEWSPAKYQLAIKCCALESDLKMLPDGDNTEIGERGITLSGGQRQRIAMARAVYADADLYLLDDVISAVDAHVGMKIFQAVEVVMRDKTRLMATNQLHLLPHADRIVVLKDGKIFAVGGYEELIGRGIDFATLVETDASPAAAPVVPSVLSGLPASASAADRNTRPSAGGYRRRGSVEAQARAMALEEAADQISSDFSVQSGSTENKSGKSGAMMQKEERAVGAVKLGVFASYLSAGGVSGVFAVLVLFTMKQIVDVFLDFWLSFWTSDELDRGSAFYLTGYATLSAITVCAALVRWLSVVRVGLIAAEQMHDDMLDSVLRAPVSFFDTTPLGRVLNRFQLDARKIDMDLYSSYHAFLLNLFLIIGILAVQLTINYFFVLAFTPAVIIYYRFQNFYRKTSREMRRLHIISKSPVSAHMAESLAGVSTIRAYQAVERFTTINEKRLDLYTIAYLFDTVGNRWLAVRLEMLGTSLVSVVCLFAVWQKDTISPADVGLTISAALVLTQTMNMLVRNFADVEASMASVERVLYYSNNIEQERDYNTSSEISAKLPAVWPSEGKIFFEGVQMRYRPDLPIILKGVTLEVRAGTSVGICGRTGAGKSSLVGALFRLVELCGGRILIDGVDIATVGLGQLRERLAIIPQDAFLFNSNVRENLDPSGRSSESELLDVLTRVRLSEAISAKMPHVAGKPTPNPLDFAVGEGGANLSQGQRQLICIARALLKKCPVLVLDEATSSIDYETDAIIQEMIRKEFKGRTVLTIAHRINTIDDYDYIVVMKDGVVAEYDKPGVLRSQPGSLYAALVADHSV
eukprot:TRINITY_DN5618_c0_g1_i1.p1 TRINITY_DN5618_c0_g1~~TRINITY_DN5618_c0_g1_i1.p1  ORF type:complete len:1399 (-),score=364.82 TRINITY_DN5618_c0_g1_i1:59-4255(-)